MNLKKNFLFNSILTVVGYISPLITFPYVSRVLGAENIGICNFIDGIIDYYILFAAFGIGTLGIREIAKCADDHNKKSTVFSSLIILNLISTSVVFIILVISINIVPQFEAYRSLLWIGTCKLIFSLFLVEWFFQGIQNFKYISISTILIRVLYVTSVFIFVKNKNDYNIYYILICFTTVISAIVNISYSRKFVVFSIENIKIKDFIKPFFIFGLNKVFIAFYTTYNIIYLGLTCSIIEVGYYTVAIKLYAIIMAFFSAFTLVLLPKMSVYVHDRKLEEVKLLVEKMIIILLIISLPIIIFSVFFAGDIIYFIAGSGYDGSKIPFIIVLPLIIIVGLAQIYNQQLLMCLNDNRGLLITTFTAAIIGITLNFILVRNFYSVGSALSWVFSEIISLYLAVFFVKKNISIKFPVAIIINNLLASIPYVLILFLAKRFVDNYWLSVFISVACSVLYFFCLHLYIRRNEIVYTVISNLKSWKYRYNSSNLE